MGRRLQGSRRHTQEAISKTSCVVTPAKAGIQSVQGLLDCPIKSDYDIKVALRAVLLDYSNHNSSDVIHFPLATLRMNEIAAGQRDVVARFALVQDGHAWFGNLSRSIALRK